MEGKEGRRKKKKRMGGNEKGSEGKSRDGQGRRETKDLKHTIKL